MLYSVFIASNSIYNIAQKACFTTPLQTEYYIPTNKCERNTRTQSSRTPSEALLWNWNFAYPTWEGNSQSPDPLWLSASPSFQPTLLKTPLHSPLQHIRSFLGCLLPTSSYPPSKLQPILRAGLKNLIDVSTAQAYRLITSEILHGNRSQMSHIIQMGSYLWNI
jgi:hypothetical protein